MRRLAYILVRLFGPTVQPFRPVHEDRFVRDENQRTVEGLLPHLR